MEKVVLVEDNQNRRKLFGVNIELYLGLSPIFLNDADEVMEYLKKNDDVRLVVTKSGVRGENTSLKIFYYIKSNKLEIPIICLGISPKLSAEKSVTILEEDNPDVISIVKPAAKALGITAEKMLELEVPEMYPIPIGQFLCPCEIECDVFKLNDSEEYEVLFNKDSYLDKDLVREMILEGEKCLYVPKMDRLKLAMSLTDGFSEMIRSESLEVTEQAQATSDIFQTSQQLISELGLTEGTVKKAQTTIDSMEDMINRSQHLSDLLSIFKTLTGGFAYKHSVLTATLCHHCLEEMVWGTKNQLSALCFAGYFHDILLEDDSLAEIHSEEELKILDPSDRERRMVELHAFKSVELLEDHPEIPHGAKDIIIQHHGMLNGIGFADRPNLDVAPVSALFQVVEYFVRKMLTEKDFNPVKTIQEMRKVYIKGIFKTVVDALSDVAQNKM